jgi:hypothetical protein
MEFSHISSEDFPVPQIGPGDEKNPNHSKSGGLTFTILLVVCGLQLNKLWPISHKESQPF